MKAMAPNPDNRYLNADEMLADLEEFRKNPTINFEYNLNEFSVASPEEEDRDKTQIHAVRLTSEPGGKTRAAAIPAATERTTTLAARRRTRMGRREASLGRWWGLW